MDQDTQTLIIQTVLGCIPSFYSVIGFTSMAKQFEKTKQLMTPLIAGIAWLLYEITGDFGRTSGNGSTVDIYDIVAILIGI